jgi:hypothetical protein
MTLVPNAATLAADANGALTVSAGKLRGAFRRLFTSDWTERWMVVVNDHAMGTLSRDAEGLSLAWFDDSGGPTVTAEPSAPLASLHQEIACKLNVAPSRVVFLPIGE